jgi:hypothetical protein
MRKNTFKNNFTCEMKVNSLMDGKKQKKKKYLDEKKFLPIFNCNPTLLKDKIYAYSIFITTRSIPVNSNTSKIY